MATIEVHATVIETRAAIDTEGGIVAAIVAAAIGSFAVGLIAFLGAVGLLSLPPLYEPAGGVTSRTALAVAVWLVAWFVLHRRWRQRPVRAGRLYVIALVLTLMGVVGTLPPVWSLF